MRGTAGEGTDIPVRIRIEQFVMEGIEGDITDIKVARIPSSLVVRGVLWD